MCGVEASVCRQKRDDCQQKRLLLLDNMEHWTGAHTRKLDERIGVREEQEKCFAWFAGWIARLVSQEELVRWQRVQLNGGEIDTVCTHLANTNIIIIFIRLSSFLSSYSFS